MSDNKNLSIKHWDESERPREKLLQKGRDALSDSELMGILLGSGNTKQSAVELAREILQSCNNQINELAKLSIHDLMKFKGIGEAKAITIAAALELGRRRKADSVQRVKIRSSKEVFEYMLPVMDNKPYEEFWIVLLNRANRILSREMISVGSLTASLADPRKIFKLALEKPAAAIILCHNHPSGNLQASESDMQLTRKLYQGGKLLDINVLDHLIFGDNAYYSFADEGMMNF